MNVEIERKFLIRNDTWKEFVLCHFPIQQGYFPTSDGSAIRARISDNGSYITVKLPKVNGNECPEFEYNIPLEDAQALIEFCEPHVVRKHRYIVEWDNQTWEVDVFEGKLAGIVVAEIELTSIDEDIVLPSWVGPEVTDDIEFTNKYMAFHY